MSKTTDIRICEVEIGFEEYPYRTPLKFGGVVTTHCVLMNITLQVENSEGKRSGGFGSMPLGNAWSFPSQRVSFDESMAAMRRLGNRMVDITRQVRDSGHPIDLMVDLEHRFLDLAVEVGKERKQNAGVSDRRNVSVAKQDRQYNCFNQQVWR